MEGPHIFDSEKYVKKAEGYDPSLSTSEEMQASLAKLEKPLGDVEYAERGNTTVNTEGLQVNLSYSPLDEKLKSNVLSYINREMKGNNELVDPFKWKVLDSMEFITKDSQVNMVDVLPNDYKIVFCPTSLDTNNGSVNISEKVIYIFGDIVTPLSVITLLHEIGHIFDHKNLEKAGVDKLTTDHMFSNEAERLRKERTASAFAIKAMKPYFKLLGIKTDSINYLKDHALASYYMWVKHGMIEQKQTNKFMTSEYPSGFDTDISDTDQRIMDFEEWRKTDAYKKWKVADEFKDLPSEGEEAYLEYIAWSNWLDKTKYDYSADIDNID